MPHDILQEHVYIRLITDRMRVVMAAPETTLPQARWRKLFDLELRGMLSACKRHFGHEERGGYMKGVIKRHPETEHKFGELFEQHAQMKAQIHELIAANEAGTPLPELRTGIKSLLAHLAAHEAAETELVQDAIQHDTGGGD